MLVIEAHEIKGECPVHQEKDKIIVEDPEVDVERTDRICTHAMQTILHYTTALENGVDPVKLGLSKGDEDTAYLQCVDPGKDYTGGGTVIFNCSIR